MSLHTEEDRLLQSALLLKIYPLLPEVDLPLVSSMLTSMVRKLLKHSLKAMQSGQRRHQAHAVRLHPGYHEKTATCVELFAGNNDVPSKPYSFTATHAFINRNGRAGHVHTEQHFHTV